MNIRLQNLGTANKNRILIDTEFNWFKIYYSYETIVGIEYTYRPTRMAEGEYFKFISKNEWSKTTGKFLNELEPDKKKRLDYLDFQKESREMFRLIKKSLQFSF